MTIQNNFRAPEGATVNQPRARIDDVRDAALSLFAKRGYHGTTMSEIATALGVKVPTLYHHISSKQDLLAEIIVETTDAVWDDFQNVVAGVDDIGERLKYAIRAYAFRHATHWRQALVVNHDVFNLEEPTLSIVLDARHRHEHAVRGLINEGIESGTFHVESSLMASFAMLEMSVSVARWFHDGGQLRADQVAEQYSQFALRMVMSPS
jgi:AcrR family transcriptional regulator